MRILNATLCVFVVYVQIVCTKAGTKRFAYVSKPDLNGNRHSYGVCICAKCGSTSAFNAIHNSLFSFEFVAPKGGPWVHEFKSWSSPNVYSWEEMYNKFGHNNFDEVYLVTRTPLERYISAFYSKVMCCEARANESCAFNPKGAALESKNLRKVAHMSDNNKPCLDFEEYSNILLKIFTAIIFLIWSNQNLIIQVLTKQLTYLKKALTNKKKKILIIILDGYMVTF